jgi:hypothetical protein
MPETSLETGKSRALLHHVGVSRAPVVTIDNFWGNTAPVIALAAALGPFPPSTNYYPGVRRVIGRDDGDAFAYINGVLERAAPYILGAFGIASFRIGQASFSMITTPSDQLDFSQRAPHFDSVESKYLAILHYLVPNYGTAFYRHRSSGVEEVTNLNLDRYVTEAKSQAAATPPGYIADSNAYYEQIGTCQGLRDRLVIYPGRLLHSALVPQDITLSDDPSVGRITSNIFIKGAE